MTSPYRVLRTALFCGAAAGILAGTANAAPVAVPKLIVPGPAIVSPSEPADPEVSEISTDWEMGPILPEIAGTWHFDQALTDSLREPGSAQRPKPGARDVAFTKASSIEIEEQGIGIWTSFIKLHSACSILSQDAGSLKLQNCTSVSGKLLDAKSDPMIAQIDVFHDGAGLVALASTGTIWAFSR